MTSFRKPFTVAVYRVNTATGERSTVHSKRALSPRKTADQTTAWPPCRCPRHRGSA